MDNRKNVKVIDPLHASKEDKKLLCALMQHYPHADLSEENFYSITINNDKPQSYTLKLKSDIKWCKTDGAENYYEIHQRKNLIGSGGFGIVMCAVPIILTRDGKLKYKLDKEYVVKEQTNIEEENLPRAMREVDLMRRLSALHAKPLQIKKLNSGKLTTLFRMRRIPGKELFNIIRDDQMRYHELTFLERLNLSINLLYALQEVHAAGVVHRDIKPENVLVSGEKVRLIDYGLSQALDHLNKNECSGSVMYAPPELFLRQETYASADIFSMGMMLRLLWRGSGRNDEVISKLPGYFVSLMGEPNGQLFAGLTDVSREAADAIFYCLKTATLYAPNARPSLEAMLDCFELVKFRKILAALTEPMSDELVYTFEEAQYLRRVRVKNQILDDRVAILLASLEKIPDSRVAIYVFKSFLGYDFMEEATSKAEIKKSLQNFLVEYTNQQQLLAKQMTSLDALCQLADNNSDAEFKGFQLKLARLKASLQHWQQKLVKGIYKDLDEFALMQKKIKKFTKYYELKLTHLENHPLTLACKLQIQLKSSKQSAFNLAKQSMLNVIKSELLSANKNQQHDLKHYQMLLTMLFEARNLEELRFKFTMLMPKKLFSFFIRDQWREKLVQALNDPVYGEAKALMEMQNR